jgi:hypothetical protein
VVLAIFLSICAAQEQGTSRMVSFR